jgi:hypothetical protein
MALVQVTRLLKEGSQATVVTDCQGIINGVQAGKQVLRKGKKHAGLWRKYSEFVGNKGLDLTRKRSDASAAGDLGNLSGVSSAIFVVTGIKKTQFFVWISDILKATRPPMQWQGKELI